MQFRRSGGLLRGQALDLTVKIPLGLLQVFDGLLRILLPCPADILDRVAEMEAQLLVLDEVDDLDLPVGVV